MCNFCGKVHMSQDFDLECYIFYMCYQLCSMYLYICIPVLYLQIVMYWYVSHKCIFDEEFTQKYINCQQS